MAERPTPPDVTFDWQAEDWSKWGERMLALVTEASVGWERRRPSSPSGPHEVRARYRDPLPRQPVPMETIAQRLEGFVADSTYIGHPRWLGYVTSSPTPVGVMGDLITSAVNPNLGLWRGGPAGTSVEAQTIDWLKEMLGFPMTGEGIYSSGGQYANIIGHLLMRNRMAGWDVRRLGMRAGPQLRVYASEELHFCHQQAAHVLGMGTDAVRTVPTDDAYRMRLDALKEMVNADRANGDRPIGIVPTAGTVGTGAVDPIPDLLEFARDEGLWLHVDGAYGAFAAIAPSAPPELAALAEADSVACDPHKWLYAPIDAGVTLVRERGLLKRTFSFHASYLHTGTEEADRIDFAEHGPENSRRARGLKVWMAMQAHGLEGYRAMIDWNIRLATHMAAVVEETSDLVLAAPPGLSITCWRVEPPGVAEDRLDALQVAILEELERQGIAIVSQASLKGGRTALRACIVNFRTTADDLEQVLAASAEIGRSLAAR